MSDIRFCKKCGHGHRPGSAQFQKCFGASGAKTRTAAAKYANQQQEDLEREARWRAEVDRRIQMWKPNGHSLPLHGLKEEVASAKSLIPTILNSSGEKRDRALSDFEVETTLIAEREAAHAATLGAEKAAATFTYLSSRGSRRKYPDVVTEKDILALDTYSWNRLVGETGRSHCSPGLWCTSFRGEAKGPRMVVGSAAGFMVDGTDGIQTKTAAIKG